MLRTKNPVKLGTASIAWLVLFFYEKKRNQIGKKESLQYDADGTTWYAAQGAFSAAATEQTKRAKWKSEQRRGFLLDSQKAKTTKKKKKKEKEKTTKAKYPKAIRSVDLHSFFPHDTIASAVILTSPLPNLT